MVHGLGITEGTPEKNQQGIMLDALSEAGRLFNDTAKDDAAPSARTRKPSQTSRSRRTQSAITRRSSRAGQREGGRFRADRARPSSELVSHRQGVIELRTGARSRARPPRSKILAQNLGQIRRAGSCAFKIPSLVAEKCRAVRLSIREYRVRI
jgi:hypothetical protein